MATAVQAAPQEGDYWTDGVRLVEVMGMQKEGDYVVEDVATGLTMDLPIAAFASSEVWRLVRHGAS